MYPPSLRGYLLSFNQGRRERNLLLNLKGNDPLTIHVDREPTSLPVPESIASLLIVPKEREAKLAES